MIREEKCGACPVSKAIQSLQELQSDPAPVEVTICPPAAAMRVAGRIKKVRRVNFEDPKTRTHKPCNICHKDLPLAEYGKNKTCADGHEGTCRGCKKLRIKAAYLKKRGKAKAGKLPSPSAAPDPVDSDLNCILCHAAATSPERLASHMRVVHNYQSA